ncbi:hypothetical protein L1887_06714 [Cichorium endivia]|nr:hypothetical protein L1887_06714 [Cichorium endivia]
MSADYSKVEISPPFKSKQQHWQLMSAGRSKLLQQGYFPGNSNAVRRDLFFHKFLIGNYLIFKNCHSSSLWDSQHRLFSHFVQPLQKYVDLKMVLQLHHPG